MTFTDIDEILAARPGPTTDQLLDRVLAEHGYPRPPELEQRA
ncbi:hypothetical protein Ppa06_26250 [Planomonospora parontospora subsp. parontospora]|uniref:Uncharacterized protein n=2 Tax=Planomonospora parontospora TaxID=58119 RepID=A0AA37F3P8_9ACTN|nr:hypothetical protein [Planomonospora parontospora]GGK60003.1 hypothetical protein GCM10010126_19430 [Planomonospora parontospora]GII08827.1 hypothetical protein Ppa06_26250 [Planomonospora parontospora subsp. parontospora]